MTGLIAIACLVGLCAAVLRLGSRIEPRRKAGGDPFAAGGDLPLLPFGRQTTEPVDAERARTGRPF